MLRLIIGLPGSGKTTVACKDALLNSKRYRRTYLNFENTVPDCGSADLYELGKWTFIPGSWVGADESGIEYNNRKFKSFPEYAIRWYKKYRHYGVDMDLYSQYTDLDSTLMRLIEEVWVLYKVGPWTLHRKALRRFATVDGELKIILEFASLPSIFLFPFALLGLTEKKWRLTFRPFYYKYFDSWACDDLPIKDFPVHNPKKLVSMSELDSDIDDEAKPLFCCVEEDVNNEE